MAAGSNILITSECKCHRIPVLTEVDVKKTKVKMFAVSDSVLLLLFLYFIQGFPYGIQTHFLPVYLRSHGADLTDVGLLRLLQAPWLMKIIWAPFIDAYFTRRRWLLITVFLLTVSSILSAFNAPDKLHPMSLAALLLWNLFASIQDVSVDAVAVSLLSASDVAAGNVAQIVGYKVGAAFAGGIVALLVTILNWSGMCLVLTAVYAEAALLVYMSPTFRRINRVQHGETSDNGQHHNCTSSHACHGRHVHVYCPHTPSHVNNDSDNFHCHAKQHHVTEHHDDSSADGKSNQQLNVLAFFQQIFRTPGISWMMVYLLIYKLGEQGALSLLPMFLLDHKVETNDVTFWNGIVGQVVSIGGSLFGGWFVTKFSQMPLQFMLQQMCLLRLLPVGIQLLLIVVWNTELLNFSILFYGAVTSLLLLTFLSGVVTTATFTLMMRFSGTVSTEIQATHYTTLATVEVVGKLLFTSASGWLANSFGYRVTFLIFVILSGLVLPWLKRFPENLDSSLEVEAAVSNDNDGSKEHAS